jgi:hypothetical protein
LKLREDGCVLCGSTWGNFWAEIDSERRFFCCELCAVQMLSLIAGLRRELGASTVRGLVIDGDRRGRTASVEHDGGVSRYQFVFDSEGQVHRLRREPAPERAG